MSSPKTNMDVWACSPDQMYTPEEQSNPPRCNNCEQRCFDVYMRIFRFTRNTENFCSQQCWATYGKKPVYPENKIIITD